MTVEMLHVTDEESLATPEVAFVARERAEAVGEVSGYFPRVSDNTHTEVVERALAWFEAGWSSRPTASATP